jgi:hypothetical protein
VPSTRLRRTAAGLSRSLLLEKKEKEKFECVLLKKNNKRKK